LIDLKIAKLVKKIFKDDYFEVDEWIEFCAAPTKAGGFAMLLPGYHFKVMN